MGTRRGMEYSNIQSKDVLDAIALQQLAAYIEKYGTGDDAEFGSFDEAVLVVFQSAKEQLIQNSNGDPISKST